VRTATAIGKTAIPAGSGQPASGGTRIKVCQEGNHPEAHPPHAVEVNDVMYIMLAFLCPGLPGGLMGKTGGKVFFDDS